MVDRPVPAKAITWAVNNLRNVRFAIGDIMFRGYSTLVTGYRYPKMKSLQRRKKVSNGSNPWKITLQGNGKDEGQISA